MKHYKMKKPTNIELAKAVAVILAHKSGDGLVSHVSIERQLRKLMGVTTGRDRFNVVSDLGRHHGFKTVDQHGKQLQ